jgi:hypothetical protein
MPEPAYRVFLSHSGKDKDFVKELWRRLTRDGVSCFFDIESIGWGENWVKALERALAGVYKLRERPMPPALGRAIYSTPHPLGE